MHNELIKLVDSRPSEVKLISESTIIHMEINTQKNKFMSESERLEREMKLLKDNIES